MQAPARDPRRIIARLAVAVMAADGRITPTELDATRRLEDLGLGHLSDFVDDEIRIAMAIPVDVEQACVALGPLNRSAAVVLLAAMADVAASDEEVTENELAVLRKIARCLGLSSEDASVVLNQALGLPKPPVEREANAAARPTAQASIPRPAPPPPPPPPASRIAHDALDAEYLEQVRHYDLGNIALLGPEFVVLAVRKLARLTGQYEAAIARRESST